LIARKCRCRRRWRCPVSRK